ncbi:MAG TPA: lactate utilization protein C [Terracidiphilus sp.]|jgi:L-lactate dehydrogenase complex protein LldG
MSSSSRQTILDRIRSATGKAEAGQYDDLPRNYIRTGLLNTKDKLALLVERLREYDAEVVEAAETELISAIGAQLGQSGRQSFLAPSGLPRAWQTKGFAWSVDNGLTTAEIELGQGVVTGASCAIADSGTIVLHHSSIEGRRALTLLPDWHLCILRASQVVETLPEYFRRYLQPPTLATYISGPSATADIEMTRIKGVHGPRFLHVILVRDDR